VLAFTVVHDACKALCIRLASFFFDVCIRLASFFFDVLGFPDGMVAAVFVDEI
jgi:hypothetical protein